MSDPIDPAELIKRVPPGMALYAREWIDGGREEIAWLVREESARIGQLGPNPEVEFRAGLFEESINSRAVALVPVLVRIGPETAESVYETWVNEHAPGGHALEILANQKRIAIHLHGDRGKLVRSLQITNRLRPFAQQALARVAALPIWGMRHFDQARENCSAQYPTPFDLWQALQGKTP